MQYCPLLATRGYYVGLGAGTDGGIRLLHPLLLIFNLPLWSFSMIPPTEFNRFFFMNDGGHG